MSCLINNKNLICFLIFGITVYDVCAIIAHCYKFPVAFLNLVVAFIMAVKHGAGEWETQTQVTCNINSPRNASWVPALLDIHLIVAVTYYKIFTKRVPRLSSCHEAISMRFEQQIWMKKDTDLFIIYHGYMLYHQANGVYREHNSVLVQIHQAKIFSYENTTRWSGGQHSIWLNLSRHKCTNCYKIRWQTQYMLKIY